LLAIEEVTFDKAANILESVWRWFCSRDVNLRLDPFSYWYNVLASFNVILGRDDLIVGFDEVFTSVCVLGGSIGAELPLAANIASSRSRCSNLSVGLVSSAWVDIDGGDTD
jgi:hypothetical protein